MRWVNLGEREPSDSDKDANWNVVIRYKQGGQFIVEPCDIFDAADLAHDKSIAAKYEWLEGAFDDKPTLIEAVKMLERLYPSRNEMKE